MADTPLIKEARSMPTVYRIQRLFAGSCLALLVIGLTFAIRGDIIGSLGKE